MPSLLIARISFRGFAAAIAEPAALGFATTSSEAALPLAMERMEEFGVPRWIVSFVIPMGYSFNMTGGSVYLSMAAIFAAQAAGIHLSLGEQVRHAAHADAHQQRRGRRSARLAGDSSGLGRRTATFPPRPFCIILGVDTLMDMGRTAMNVIGNCMAAAVVARWEGEMHGIKE